MTRFVSFPRLPHLDQVRRLQEELVGKLRRQRPHRGEMRKKKWIKAQRNAPIVFIVKVESSSTIHYPGDPERREVVPAIRLYWLQGEKIRDILFSNTRAGSARFWILQNFPPTIQELENGTENHRG